MLSLRPTLAPCSTGSTGPSRITRCASLLIVTTLAACAGSKGGPPYPVGPPLGYFPQPFQIIAHRGASAYAPENSMPAFERALELGAFEVELDVQLSSDGVVVLYHDATLSKKTGQEGKVGDYTRDELVEFEIGTWFDASHPEVTSSGASFAGTKLITLASLFERFGSDLYYHVELKSAEEALARATWDAIQRAGLSARVRITSFSFEQVERARSLDANVPVTLLIRDADSLFSVAATAPEQRDDLALLALQQAEIDRAAEAGFDQVGIASHDLNLAVVGYAIDKGLGIRAWRIKSDRDMRHTIAVGAQGMTTNWPDRLIRLLVEFHGSEGGDFIEAP